MLVMIGDEKAGPMSDPENVTSRITREIEIAKEAMEPLRLTFIRQKGQIPEVD